MKSKNTTPLSRFKELLAKSLPWAAHLSEEGLLNLLKECAPSLLKSLCRKEGDVEFVINIPEGELVRRFDEADFYDYSDGPDLPRIAMGPFMTSRTFEIGTQSIENTLLLGGWAMGMGDPLSVRPDPDSLADAGFALLKAVFLPDPTNEYFITAVLSRLWKQELKSPGFAWKAAQTGILTAICGKWGYMMVCDLPADSKEGKAFNEYARLFPSRGVGNGPSYGKALELIPDLRSPDESSVLASACWAYKHWPSLRDELDSVSL